MKEFAWFCLAIKAVGVLLIGMSLSSVLYPLQFIRWFLDGDMGIGAIEIVTAAIVSLGPIMQFGFGLYLLLGGRWIINRCLHVVNGHCLVCGYDVRGLEVDVCPECGTSIAESGSDATSSRVKNSSV